MSIISTVTELFHSLNLFNTAARAESKIVAAKKRVTAAELALRSERSEAVVELKKEEAVVSGAIVAADKMEAEREKARAVEIAEATKKHEDEIAALIAALELATRNASDAIKALKAVHAGERETAELAKKAATKALEDLAAAKAAFDAALKR